MEEIGLVIFQNAHNSEFFLLLIYILHLNIFKYKYVSFNFSLAYDVYVCVYFIKYWFWMYEFCNPHRCETEKK